MRRLNVNDERTGIHIPLEYKRYFDRHNLSINKWVNMMLEQHFKEYVEAEEKVNTKNLKQTIFKHEVLNKFKCQNES